MKKYRSLLFAFAICCLLTACSGGQSADNSTPPTADTAQSDGNPDIVQETPDAPPSEETAEPVEQEPEAAAGNGILIAYFSYGENASLADGVDATSSASIQYRGDTLTGNTGLVADMIAGQTGGELFPILTAEPYPDNYDDTLDVGQSEQRSDARPELISHIENLDLYDTVFLGAIPHIAVEGKK